MPYYLEPSLNVTVVSPTKVQLSNCANEITLEHQNSNLKDFLGLVDNPNFPACLKEQSNSDVLNEIFNFFIAHHFLVCKAVENHDALNLDLQVQNKITIPDYETTYPKCMKNIDLNTVNVFGEGVLFARVVKELINQSIQVFENPEPDKMGSGILLCCSDRPNAAFFKQINAIANKEKIPALFAQLNSNTAVVGPLVVPDETSCYNCYMHRAEPNINFVEEAAAIQQNKGNLLASKAVPSLYALETCFHVISQIVKFQNRAFHLCLINEVLELNLLDYQLDIRPVIRVPRCEHCYSEKNALPATAVRALI